MLIDALKYTSNVIVDITEKMSEQDARINKLENYVRGLEKTNRELVSKLNAKNSQQFNELISKKFANTNTNVEDEDLSTYIIEKKKVADSNIKNNENKQVPNEIYLGDGDFEGKNKIDKLIKSIINKKKNLDECKNNKEKSLLTDYNQSQPNSQIDFTVKTANETTNTNISKNTNADTNINTNMNIEENTNANTNMQNMKDAVNTLKQIRKKTNFAKRF